MTAAIDPDRPARPLTKLVAATRRLGEQTVFFGSSLALTGSAIRRYPTEVLRLIAVMGLGTGALALIGGTVAVLVGLVALVVWLVISLWSRFAGFQ